MVEPSPFEFPQKLDAYLASLSRIYDSKRKTLLEEIVVNGTVSVNEAVEQDGWNGGTYGHGLVIEVDEPIFVRIVDDKTSICNELKKDINELITVSNEFVCSVAIEMRVPQDKDWRSTSKFFQKSRSVTIPPANDLSRIWGVNGVRVFLSHKSSVKVETSQLKLWMKEYGMAGFVAHEDIEPTQEWHREIEHALFSMDALVALLTPDYHDSKWTDQEVGVAMGRGVPIILVRLGTDPYGLMGKAQGLGGCALANGKELASKIFGLLCKRLTNRARLFDAAIQIYSESTSFDSSGDTIDRLFTCFEKLTPEEVEKLLATYEANGQNKYSFRGRAALIPLLEKWTGKTWRLKNDSLAPRDEK